MNKLLFTFLTIVLVNCTLTQEPDFIKLDNYKIISANKKEIKLGTNAYFHNPNDVGCEIVSTDIDVLINGLFVGKVNQANLIHLSAGNKFDLPLLVSIPSEKIIKDKSGIFSGVLTALMSKNLTVSYEGFVTLKKAGVEFDIDIEGEEVLKEFKKF